MMTVFWLLETEIITLEKLIKENKYKASEKELRMEYQPMIDEYKHAIAILKERQPHAYRLFEKAWNGVLTEQDKQK